jgi:hypothetical protein
MNEHWKLCRSSVYCYRIFPLQIHRMYRWRLCCELINSGSELKESVRPFLSSSWPNPCMGCGLWYRKPKLSSLYGLGAFNFYICQFMNGGKSEGGKIHTSARLLYFQLNWRKGAIKRRRRKAKYTFRSRQLETQQFRVVCVLSDPLWMVSSRGRTPPPRGGMYPRGVQTMRGLH